MDIVRFFKRRVVEDKNIIFISILFTCLLRIAMFSQDNGGYSLDRVSGSSYLWDVLISDFLQANKILSFIFSFVFSLSISFCLYQINARYGLIRVRTYIVPGLVLFFLSIHPLFMLMSGAYIGALCIILSIYILLSTYQRGKVSGDSFYIGFLLAIGALFDLQTLFFLPLFLVGLRMMRCISLKAIIAMILGVVSVCWLTLFVLIELGRLDSFIFYYRDFSIDLRISPEEFSTSGFIYLISVLLVGIVLFINYQVNSFHDKIKVRTNIMFFYLSMVYAFILYSLFNGDNLVDLFVVLILESMLFSHFLSLAVEKWKIVFFYIVCVFSLITYYINLFM